MNMYQLAENAGRSQIPSSIMSIYYVNVSRQEPVNVSCALMSLGEL